MDETNSNVDQPGFMARLGNWLKKEPAAPGAIQTNSPPIRTRVPTAKADLDALERQSRKARLGQVRKTEFEELRRSIGHSPIPKSSTFSLTSALVPNTSFLARARQNTRLKIDSIEEQISRSWFNSGLHRGSAITGLATLPGSSSRPFKGPSQKEMKVELGGSLVTLAVPPEALNAATAYALGDFVTAEQVLIALTKKPDPLTTAQISWDLLFEFYLALGKQTEFDNLSVDFAARFGISPPLWADHWKPENSADADVGAPGGTEQGDAIQPGDPSTVPFTVAAYLVADDVDALAAHFEAASKHGLWQVDWRKLAEVDGDALPRLISLVERVISGTVEVSYLGATHFTDAIRRQTKLPNQSAELQRQLWHLLTMHLQLTGDLAQLEEVSFEYSILFEVSLPTATVVMCRYISEASELGEESEAAQTTEQSEAPPQEFAATPVSSMYVTKFKVLNVEAPRVEISGTLKGDISEDLGTLPLPNALHPLVFECKAFARLDSQAAGHLLGFLRSNKCSAGTVQLRRLNRLIGIYLFSFGLPQNVTIAFDTL